MIGLTARGIAHTDFGMAVEYTDVPVANMRGLEPSGNLKPYGRNRPSSVSFTVTL